MTSILPIAQMVRTINEISDKLTAHIFNNYLTIGVGNGVNLEFDVQSKAWFWSDAKVNRQPLDLFFAEYILAIPTTSKVSGEVQVKRLPNGMEAKHIYRPLLPGGKTMEWYVSFGFTDAKNSCWSGHLTSSQFQSVLRVITFIFGAFIDASSVEQKADH